MPGKHRRRQATATGRAAVDRRGRARALPGLAGRARGARAGGIPGGRVRSARLPAAAGAGVAGCPRQPGFRHAARAQRSGRRSAAGCRRAARPGGGGDDRAQPRGDRRPARGDARGGGVHPGQSGVSGGAGGADARSGRDRLRPCRCRVRRARPRGLRRGLPGPVDAAACRQRHEPAGAGRARCGLHDLHLGHQRPAQRRGGRARQRAQPVPGPGAHGIRERGGRGPAGDGQRAVLLRFLDQADSPVALRPLPGPGAAGGAQRSAADAGVPRRTAHRRARLHPVAVPPAAPGRPRRCPPGAARAHPGRGRALRRSVLGGRRRLAPLPGVQSLRSYRSHGERQPGAGRRACAADHRPRPGQRRSACGRWPRSSQDPWRQRRTVDRRRRGGARLCRRRRRGGRALPRGGLAGQRPPVPQRRPGALARRRLPGVPRADRRTGEDQRLPHRTGRDPQRAAGTPSGGRGGGTHRRGRCGRAGRGSPDRRLRHRRRGDRGRVLAGSRPAQRAPGRRTEPQRNRVRLPGNLRRRGLQPRRHRPAAGRGGPRRRCQHRPVLAVHRQPRAARASGRLRAAGTDPPAPGGQPRTLRTAGRGIRHRPVRRRARGNLHLLSGLLDLLRDRRVRRRQRRTRRHPTLPEQPGRGGRGQPAAEQHRRNPRRPPARRSPPLPPAPPRPGDRRTGPGAYRPAEDRRAARGNGCAARSRRCGAGQGPADRPGGP